MKPVYNKSLHLHPRRYNLDWTVIPSSSGPYNILDDVMMMMMMKNILLLLLFQLYCCVVVCFLVVVVLSARLIK